mgnify:FL=1
MSRLPGRSVTGSLVVVSILLGACSDGTGPGGSRPLKFLTIAAARGSASSCGISVDSTLYCWGGSYGGALGTPPPSACADALGSVPCSLIPLRVSGAPKMTALTASTYWCGLAADSVPYCWGPINYDMDLSHSFGDAPTVLSGDLKLTQLSAGFGHLCGVAADGSGHCWGEFWGGKRGDPTIDFGTGSSATSFVPNTVGGGLSFASITAAVYNTCGITTAGAAYCWGSDYLGTLGDSAAPTQPSCGAGVSPCVLAPYPVAGGLGFQSLSAGWDFYCGLTGGDAVYCWGDDAVGLGIGSSLCSIRAGETLFLCAPVPALVFGPLVGLTLSGGPNAICMIDAQGEGSCWGDNSYGQLGNGGGRGGAVAGGHIFRLIAPGYDHSCGLTTDSLAWCWGENRVGQLGDGTTRDANEPVAVLGPDAP